MLTLEDSDTRPFLLLGVALVPLLQLLPLLRSYRLHHRVGLKAIEPQPGALGLHPRTLTYLKQYARGVQELQLDSVTFRDLRELARLTMSMPSLRHLHCVHLRHSTGDPLNFTARYTNKGRLLSMNLQHVDLHAIEFLAQTSRSSLQSLVLEFNCADLAHPLSQNRVLLSTLEALQSLRISVIHDSAFGDPGIKFADVMLQTRRMICSVEHVALNRLSLSIVLPHARPTSVDHFLQDVDSALGECLSLDNLLFTHEGARVVFDLPMVKRNRILSWTEALGLKMPKLHSRGAFQVVSSADGELWGHDGPVELLQFFPEIGCTVSASTSDSNFFVWNHHPRGMTCDSASPAARLRPDIRINMFCAIPTVGRLACIEESQWITIRDVKAGAVVVRLKADDQGITALASSVDGTLVTASVVKGRFIKLNPTQIHSNPQHFVIQVWRDTGGKYSIVDKVLAEVDGRTSRLYSIHRSRTGTTVSRDKLVHVKAIALSPRGLILACVERWRSSSHVCHLWRRVQHSGSSPTGTSASARHSFFRVYYSVHDHSVPITAWAFSPTSHSSTVIPSRDPRSPFWRSPRECECFATGLTDGTVTMTYLHVGTPWPLLVDRRFHGGHISQRDGRFVQLSMWSHAAKVTSIAFSADGALVASTSADGTLKAASWAAPRQSAFGRIVTMAGHTAAVLAACFSASGELVASASEDHTVRLWRMSDGACLAAFAEHTDAVTHVVFSAEEDAIWSAARDGAVRRHPFTHLLPRV
ncbi:WD40-repeat-containing domain protein [Daedaleopsis nitida]|nr:WD40-repeat-containing domain protein [Daedaleopsis nitida]